MSAVAGFLILLGVAALFGIAVWLGLRWYRKKKQLRAVEGAARQQPWSWEQMPPGVQMPLRAQMQPGAQIPPQIQPREQVNISFVQGNKCGLLSTVSDGRF
jgi:hypothetical protein